MSVEVDRRTADIDRILLHDHAVSLAIEQLGLVLGDTSAEDNIDVRDVEGRTYRIKSRSVDRLSECTSFDLPHLEPRFDHLVAVFFRRGTLDMIGMLRVPYDAMKSLGSQTASTFRFRWNRSVADDSRVERVFWARE